MQVVLGPHTFICRRFASLICPCVMLTLRQRPAFPGLDVAQERAACSRSPAPPNRVVAAAMAPNIGVCVCVCVAGLAALGSRVWPPCSLHSSEPIGCKRAAVQGRGLSLRQVVAGPSLTTATRNLAVTSPASPPSSPQAVCSAGPLLLATPHRTSTPDHPATFSVARNACLSCQSSSLANKKLTRAVTSQLKQRSGADRPPQQQHAHQHAGVARRSSAATQQPAAPCRSL